MSTTPTTNRVNAADAANIARGLVRSLGVNISASDEAALVENLASRMHWDRERSEAFIVNEHGDQEFDLDPTGIVRELDLRSAIAREVGRVATFKPVVPSKPGSSKPQKRVTLTEKMISDLALSRGEEAKKAAAAEAARGPNPWLPQHQNISRQGLISNFDPALARQLKLAAGVTP